MTPPDPPRGALTRAQRIGALLLPPLVRVLRATWRLRVLNDGGWRARRQSNAPVIFAIWHGQLLVGVLQHRSEGVALVVSEHRDGELIARVARGLGFRLVRGSTSKGAARALLAMCRVIEDGGDLGITPDGPRGPAHHVHPGVMIAAQRTGAPVIPVGVAASRAWRLRSWDAFLVPKPFARVWIAYGDPVFVTAADARAAAAQCDQLGAAMNTTEGRAQAALATR